jgi:RNA polymerase sigma-70 factor (ECF subfamily)
VVPAPRGAGHEELDEVLLQRAKAGDAAALEAFVRHYQHRVFAFLSRSVGHGPHVDDLAQEVFLRAVRALARFRTGEAKVSTWLFQIAVRLLQDARRKGRPTPLPVSEELRDDRSSPEENTAHRRALLRVEEAAQQLPEEQRLALVLYEFHGLTHEEIGHATQAPQTTVKTRIHRARKFLREALGADRSSER